MSVTMATAEWQHKLESHSEARKKNMEGFHTESVCSSRQQPYEYKTLNLYNTMCIVMLFEWLSILQQPVFV